MTIKDGQIWETYTRAVRPARKKPHGPPAAKAAPEKSAACKAAAAEAAKMPKPNEAIRPKASAAPMLERKREKALRQGDVEIDAKLDLHGLTQAEAFEALARFMARAAATGKRHLLIVTGKGRGGAGVLRGNLESWLGQLAEARRILALRPAAARHGGGGAFYVILRKK